MKVTRAGPPRPILNSGFGSSYSVIPSGGTASQTLTSDGSNGRYWGENVARITSNGSNALLGPFVNFASGSNTIFSVTSNTLNIGTTGSAGASTTITSNGSNSLSGAINLQAGVGIALGVSGQTITITNTGTASGGSSSAGALTFISTQTLGADAATIDVTGIPATYKDLVIVILSRTSDAVEVGNLRFQVGGASIDTGANYGYERRYDGTGSSSMGGASGTNFVDAGMVAGANSSANSFASTTIEIFAYTDTSIFRMMDTTSQHFGVDRYTNHGGGAWRDVTSAIAKLRMSLAAGNYKTGTRITVYGRG